MQHTRLWAAAAIIAVVVIIGFALSVPHTRDLGAPRSPTASATTTPVVTLHDSYRGGVHTLSGSLSVPNACATVAASATVSGDASSTTGIALTLAVPQDSGICLQLAQTASFSTQISAPANLPITITVNGETATTTSP